MGLVVQDYHKKLKPSVFQHVLCVGAHAHIDNAKKRVLAFKDLGFKVSTVNARFGGRLFYKMPGKLVEKILRSRIRLYLNKKLSCKVATCKPDLVFFDKCPWVLADTLRFIHRVTESRVPLVHYNPDDPFGKFHKGWEYFIPAIPYYNVHFVPKALNVPEYKSHGAKYVFTYDRAYDPAIHRPLKLSAEDIKKYACDVGFIGSWAVLREEMIAGLIEFGIPVKIFGGGWKNKPYWNIIKHHWRGPAQYGENYAKAINGMKIALHFLRHENRDEQDSRTFEIPACGTFMLAERSADHERLFFENKEAVYFDGLKDLKNKVLYFIENKNEIDMIAKNGLKRCIYSGYSHHDRIKQFIKSTMSTLDHSKELPFFKKA